MRRHRLSAAAATSALLLTLVPGTALAVPAACDDAAPASFSDVEDGGTFAAAIECAAGYGIVGGFGDGTFQPTESVTRGQAAVFVAELIETAQGENLVPAGTNPFDDVNASGVFGPSILKLVAIDVVSGTTATTYEPGALLTRGQMAQILADALDHLGLTLDTSDAGFTDVDGLFAAAINSLANAGIVQGVTTTTYVPGANVTRGQLASFTAESIGPLDDAGLFAGEPPVDGGDGDGGGDGTTPDPLPNAGQSGTGTIIAKATNDRYTFVDSSGNQRTVIFDAADTFTVGGSAVNSVIFYGAINAGDTVTFTDDAEASDDDVHALTNRQLSSGVVGQIDTSSNTYEIVERFTNTPIGDSTPNTLNDAVTTFNYGAGTFAGAAANLADFEAAIQVGDTVAATDTNADGVYDRFTLTNASLGGTVTLADFSTDAAGTGAANSVELTIDGLGDVFDDSLGLPSDPDAVIVIGGGPFGTPPLSQSYTVNSSAATLGAALGAVSVGDTITYSRTANTETFAITDKAPAPISGTITDVTTDTGVANTISYVSGGFADNFTYDVGLGGAQSDLYFVDNLQVDNATFEAAVSAGDTFTFQADDADTDTDQTFRLTNDGPQGRIRDIASSGTFADGLKNETFDITDDASNIIVNGYATTGTQFYRVNGSEVSYATFEQFLGQIDAGGSLNDQIDVQINATTGNITLVLTTDDTI